MESHLYHIKWPPLNFTIFIPHMRNLRNGCYANIAYSDNLVRCITETHDILVHITIGTVNLLYTIWFDTINLK